MPATTTSERAPASARCSNSLRSERSTQSRLRRKDIQRIGSLRRPEFGERSSFGLQDSPYAFSYLLRPGKAPYVLAAEHLRREPMYWAMRLRAFTP